MRQSPQLPVGMELRGPEVAGSETVLTIQALTFVRELVRTFRPRIGELLQARRVRQARFDAGELPDFLAETREVRESTWTVAKAPSDLLDRRVEITGPCDRKMIINALNSGASVFMADFEDSSAPTWRNCLEGQQNLFDAVRRTIRFTAPDGGKEYALGENIATLFVRPRGLHLPEKHVLVDGEPIPGALFDFGMFFYHNAKELLARGTGPYFYLPKLESHLEARLWNDVFVRAEQAIGIARGTIRATVLIETLPAAFEMHEILWELREHSAGLNCGRWDYIFSFIKKLRAHQDRVLPDRAQVGMGDGFLRAYSLALIRTCHRRGAHAMGGMAAQIPIKNDKLANDAALERVRADKLREVTDGHDGTWVAHPGLVPLARAVFDEHMTERNQIDRVRADVSVGRDEMLRVHDGTRTEVGLRLNLRVGVQYIEAWLRGQGCVPLYDLMEDAATAEISRAQVWQWLRWGVSLDDGRVVTRELLATLMKEEMERVRDEVGDARFSTGRFEEATRLFEELATGDTFEEFLTAVAYDTLCSAER